MSAETTPLALWLRREMPRHGYPLDGPRAGGITRLADEAGVSRASVSRIVSGHGDPSLDFLRKIGKLLGQRLGDMLVYAGLAEPEEMLVAEVGAPTAPPQIATNDPFADPGDLPGDVDVTALPAEEAQVFSKLTLLTPEERRAVSSMVRLLVSQRQLAPEFKPSPGQLQRPDRRTV